MTAVGVLSDALKVINQPEMMEIGALSDLRTYLGSQESVYDFVLQLLIVGGFKIC